MITRTSLLFAALLAAGTTHAGKLPAGVIAHAAKVPAGVSRFSVDGIDVIHRKSSASQVVSVVCFIKGGVAMLDPAKSAGIDQLTLATVPASGSTKYSKDDFRRRLSNMVSTITGSAARDYAMLSLNCVREHFADTWRLFSDVIASPAVDTIELAKQRKQMSTGLKQVQTNPDAYVRFLIDSAYFGAGHPYGRHATPDEVNAMSGADLIAQWKKDFVKARILVVVVGPVERAEIEKLIHSTLASLPAGSYQDPMLPEAAGNAARSLTTVKKKIPTTYIIGRCGAPSRKSPDYWPYAMYVTALQDDLFEEVRTKRNLSYAPAAQWDPSRIATSGIYVSTTKPDSAVGVMLRTIDRYQTSPITEKLLKGHVASWMTSLGKREEGVSSQAEALGRYQIYTGDWKNAFSIIDNISRVTPADVERVADRYMHKFSYAMVGDVDQIDKALYESK